jgi:chromosomal replication initiator protein
MEMGMIERAQIQHRLEIKKKFASLKPPLVPTPEPVPATETVPATDAVAKEPVKQIPVHEIARIAGEVYGVSLIDILSSRRTMGVVRPRQVAHYLCRELTTRSLPWIGRNLGGKDHTTVMHSLRKIERLLNEGDEGLRAEIDSVRKRILEAFPPVQAVES